MHGHPNRVELADLTEDQLSTAPATDTETGPPASGALGQNWLTTRSAGVLAHLSSLPGDYGIGNLGSGARQFLDFLAAAGFRHWQVCPLGPTGYGDSPYQLFSGRAGNPYFIDLGELVSGGLLQPDDVAPLRQLPANHVDYGRLYQTFWPVLARSYDRFVARGLDEFADFGSFAAFRREHASWLTPFACFMALKTHFGGKAWTSWPVEFRDWEPALPDRLPEPARHDAARHAFYQYLFFGQWHRVRAEFADRGISIVGDVPIFVAQDSAETWQDRRIFQLDDQGRPLVVAGVPPDYFSAEGQRWGNPLYDWDRLARTGYAWWLERLRAAFTLYDIVRLDHFRGFDTYWEIPAAAAGAREGRWRKGPGLAFFAALKAALPQARIIAEDLGYTGPGVVALRKAAGVPGMKVLQFAYGHDAHNVNLPHFCTPESVAYTGTHDNTTTRGWLEGLTPACARRVDAYFQLEGQHSAWPIIRALLALPARLAMVPMQDLLDLPASATFNRPGTAEGNWRWRFDHAQLARLKAEKLSTLQDWIQLYDRSGETVVCEYSESPHPRK